MPPGRPYDHLSPRARRGRAPRRKRGEGQWALGYHEPLNPNERIKKDDDGLNVRARDREHLLPPRLRLDRPVRPARPDALVGPLHPARRGIDGGRTAILEPDELDDEFFMLRVRIDGGRSTSQQLRAIADISTTSARDTADVTDRQNIQLHWIRIEDVPAIWERLEAVGLTHRRGLRRHPARHPRLAGRRLSPPTRSSTARPAIQEIVERYVGNPAFSNLPRKFKTAISGSPHQDVAHEVNDLSFVGVVHPEHGPGFDVWVGGGLSTNPHLAQRLGALVTARRGPRGLGRRRRRSSATTATGGCAPGPG